MKKWTILYGFGLILPIVLSDCQANRCKTPDTDIHVEATMRHAYTNQNIIGRTARIVTRDNQPVCDNVPTNASFFSNFDGLAKGNFAVRSNSCDEPCSPFNYYLSVTPDSFVCVNNFRPLDKQNNSFTLSFKSYIMLELHLRSSFDAIEIVNVQLSPAVEDLRQTVSSFYSINLTPGLRRVDTTIYVHILPEETVKINFVGRTTTTYFRSSFTFSSENEPFVRKTIDF